MLFHGRADGESVITFNKVPIISQAVKTITNPVTAIVIVLRPSVIFSGEPPAVIITKPPQTINATAKEEAMLFSQVMMLLINFRKSQMVQAGWPLLATPLQVTKAASAKPANDSDKTMAIK